MIPILSRQPTFILAVNFVHVLGLSSRLSATTDDEEASKEDGDGDKYRPQYSNHDVKPEWKVSTSCRIYPNTNL